MRHFTFAAGVAAVFVISQASIGMAASSTRSTNVSYSSAQNSAQMSPRQDEPVPANCIRQECGKLWCWQMKGSSSH